MDTRLYMRVIWRFKWIFFVGLLLAMGLAILSTAKPDPSAGPPYLKYRKPASYKAQALLLVTQPGFPEGRSNIGDLMKVASGANPGDAGTFIPRFADPSRYSELALIYSTYATSDQIYAQMRRTGGPVVGNILANPIMQPGTGDAEPIIDLAGISTSPQAAIKLTNRVIDALTSYLSTQQAANGVPSAKRAILVPLNRPQKATVFVGHKKTKPMFVFMTIMLATIGLCFLLENIRPRVAVAASAIGPVEADTLSPDRSSSRLSA